MKSKPVATVLTWMVVLLIPLAVIMLGVRLLLTPLFLEFEYRVPWFPEDSYGFSRQDRLQWSKPSVEYLLNGEGIDFLANLKYSDGKQIYTERELSHMADVKSVVQKFVKAWYVDLGLLILLGIWAWLGGWRVDYLRGWKYGGYLTIGLLVGLGVFAATSFWQFFSLFHSLFFTGNTWIFEFSDTLIRLFPIRFWEDIVDYLAGFSILTGLALGLGLKPENE